MTDLVIPEPTSDQCSSNTRFELADGRPSRR